MFYYFVESQRNPFVDPILLWFVGGPGCSALSAFFFENGREIQVPFYTMIIDKSLGDRASWLKYYVEHFYLLDIELLTLRFSLYWHSPVGSPFIFCGFTHYHLI